jgi:hypothetical protein
VKPPSCDFLRHEAAWLSFGEGGCSGGCIFDGSLNCDNELRLEVILLVMGGIVCAIF